MGRQSHYLPLSERFAPAPPAPPKPRPVEAMLSTEDAARRGALRAAQADPRTGVRHHQVGARIPSIFTARAGESARRVESGDHGVEPEANVRPRPCLKVPERGRHAPVSAINRNKWGPVSGPAGLEGGLDSHVTPITR